LHRIYFCGLDGMEHLGLDIGIIEIKAVLCKQRADSALQRGKWNAPSKQLRRLGVRKFARKAWFRMEAEALGHAPREATRELGAFRCAVRRVVRGLNKSHAATRSRGEP
jgi:hypothetical protein